MNYKYDVGDLTDDAARQIANYINRLLKDKFLSEQDGEVKAAVREAIEYARETEKEPA